MLGRHTFSLLAILLAVGTAQAQQSAVFGAGTASCASWIEAQQDPRAKLAMRQWLMGFLTGANWRDNQQSFPIDDNAFYALVTNYCTAHPDQPLVYGADEALNKSPKVERPR